jgi:hypothetical protein
MNSMRMDRGRSGEHPDEPGRLGGLGVADRQPDQGGHPRQGHAEGDDQHQPGQGGQGAGGDPEAEHQQARPRPRRATTNAGSMTTGPDLQAGVRSLADGLVPSFTAHRASRAPSMTCQAWRLTAIDEGLTTADRQCQAWRSMEHLAKLARRWRPGAATLCTTTPGDSLARTFGRKLRLPPARS